MFVVCFFVLFCLMIRRPPRSTRTDTRFPYTTLFRSIEPLSVREFIAAQKEDSQLSARIVMRNRPALNASMRMIGECRCHLDRVFNPAGFLADPDSGLEYLTVPVTEGVNEG